MTFNEKIKVTDNKIEQNKTQYYLDRQTDMISVLLSLNVQVEMFYKRKD